jgi:DNA repair protein RadC
VELLSVLLGSGNKKRDVFSLAHEILPLIDSAGPSLSAAKLKQIPGIGPAKAALLVSALEFARRRIRPAGSKITCAADIYPLLRHFADRRQEHFISISLNGAHEVIALRVVTIGLVNVTQVHPREVFADPLCDRACALIVAHNHPSGNLTPSKEDLNVTEVLKQAGKLLGIKLLDHVIFGSAGYRSLNEEGVSFSYP